MRTEHATGNSGPWESAPCTPVGLGACLLLMQVGTVVLNADVHRFSEWLVLCTLSVFIPLSVDSCRRDTDAAAHHEA